MNTLRFLLLVLALVPLAASHAALSPCGSGLSEGEALLAAERFAEARRVLEEALTACRKSGEDKAARPFLALGKAYFELHRPKDAIPLFTEAIAREPKLTTAHMNLGAAHIAAGDYERAVDSLKRALDATNPVELARVNYNLGLAYFKRAAARNDETDLRSEPYFRKSRELDDKFGGSFYYLGVIAEVMKKDATVAREMYRQGCERKFALACEWLGKLDRQLSSANERTGRNDQRGKRH